jgi:hypothetical protein
MGGTSSSASTTSAPTLVSLVGDLKVVGSQADLAHASANDCSSLSDAGKKKKKEKHQKIQLAMNPEVVKHLG